MGAGFPKSMRRRNEAHPDQDALCRRGAFAILTVFQRNRFGHCGPLAYISLVFFQVLL